MTPVWNVFLTLFISCFSRVSTLLDLMVGYSGMGYSQFSGFVCFVKKVLFFCSKVRSKCVWCFHEIPKSVLKSSVLHFFVCKKHEKYLKMPFSWYAQGVLITWQNVDFSPFRVFTGFFKNSTNTYTALSDLFSIIWVIIRDASPGLR
jgi:hypothetical protein